MRVRQVIVAVALVGIVGSNAATAAAGENEELRYATVDGLRLQLPVVSAPPVAGRADRPVILPALYTSLGVMQAWDLYSTSEALKAGAREVNPAAAPFARNARAMMGLKAATTASTIFFAERMWRKNKVGAIVMMAAINGATAAVSAHNMRNAKKLNTR